MKVWIFLMVVAASVSGCKKENDTVCGCLQNEIKKFGFTACTDGASVKEYAFNGSTVYVFDAGPCISDQAYLVRNARCDMLGTLGGIGGLSKINGVDFWSHSEYRRTVWHN